MSAPAYHYTAADVANALRAAGVNAGDILFVHASLGRLGYPDTGRNMAAACATVWQGLTDAVGPDGTVLVPTYTYSIGKGESFDVAATPSAVGEFTEHVRTLPGAVRSADPMLSVTGHGARAAELLNNLPHTCYGRGSLYDRLHDAGARIVTIGLDLFWATYRHYIEEWCGVPFRFRKLFHGNVRENNQERRETWIYSVAPLTENCAPNGIPLQELAIARDLCRIAPVGRGQLCIIGCREYRALGEKVFPAAPWLSAKGPPLTLEELIAREDQRVGCCKPAVSLPAEAGAREIVETLAPLRRDLISDGYDAALEALTAVLPLSIQAYPSGTSCFTWIVPEKWTCHEARLETMDGRRLFSDADHPLHVVSYSLPFDGVVMRDELFAHLHTHPKLPEATPFIFKYYQRDWGLCCSANLKASLTDEQYRVMIRSDTSFGTLKVGEFVLPGLTDDCIVLCAHLCHPAQVADDISGVAAAISVMRELQRRGRLRHTYRLLIVPETIGSVAWLSRHEHVIPTLKGGLFLEMVSLPNPPALQMSFDGQSEVDRCFGLALAEHDPEGWTGAFRTIIGNDERQFNAPGVRVPMLSLSRVLPPSHPDWPYREYHSTADNIAAASWPHLSDTVDLVLRMIETLEANVTPQNLFQGEVFLSRYGLHIDIQENPAGHRALFDILYRIDGRHSIGDIAQQCAIPFSAALKVVEELRRHGLVIW